MSTLQYHTPTPKQSTNGKIYCLLDENEYIYLFIAHKDYPSHLTSGLLSEMKQKFYEANPTAAQAPIQKSSAKSEFLKVIANKYDDPGQWDALSAANMKINQVKYKMQESVKNIAENRDEMLVIKI